jgi:hypothetical protein
MDYYCKDCHAEAFVRSGAVVRTCNHADSTIIAPRTSVLYGEGGALSLSMAERFSNALNKLFKAFS